MKRTTKILALFLAVLMAVTCLSASVTAAGTASITVSGSDDGTVSIGAKTLRLYKIFSASGNGANISYDWDNVIYKEFFVDYFPSITVAEVENITHVVNEVVALKDRASDMHAFAIALEQFILDKNIAHTDEKTAGTSDTSLTFSGLDYGYYLVTDVSTTQVGDVLSGIMLTTATGDAQINIKASKPSLEKTIYALTDAANVTWSALNAANPTVLNAKGASVSLDQAVWYKLTVTVPNTEEFHAGYYLRLNDSLNFGRTAMTADRLTVTVGSTEIDLTPYYDEDGTGTADDGYFYPGSYASGTGRSDGILFDTDVVYKDSMLPAGAVAGEKVFPDNAIINLYYAAQLNNYFDLSLTNTATLCYTNDPSKSANAQDNYTCVTSSAVVYTNNLAISKRASHTDGTATTTLLSGAKFKVYRTDASKNRIGDALTFYKLTDSEGYDRYSLVADDTANADALNNITGVTPIDFAALKADSEKYTTVLSVHGENDPAHVDNPNTWADDTGTLILHGLSAGYYEIEEVEAPDGYVLPTSHFYLTVNNTYGPLTGAIIAMDCFTSDDNANDGADLIFVSSEPAKQHAHLLLTNRPGDALPETGGMGTTLFTVLGIALMVGAACFFTSKGGANKKSLS